jgi:hypothetical protein
MASSREPSPRTPVSPTSSDVAPAGNELVVFMTRTEGKCAECDAEHGCGDFIRLEKGRPSCLDCADLGHLEFLPRGDAALTRRASRRSPLRAPVVQWSRRRKRYERQGVLVLPEAITAAEAECAADADARAARNKVASVRRAVEDRAFVARAAEEIRRLFPGCPADSAQRIASHACAKHSGRVGRTAAAKELDEKPLRLAVIAHLRHEHTDYDDLLMKGEDRSGAREIVRDRIDAMLRAWERA